MSVQGRTYTSNVAKLLKHMDKLQALQRGAKEVSPVMIHLATNNACNLKCSFCCYGNRELKQQLTLEQAKSAVFQFKVLGALGIEHTGGGEPTLWPHLNELVDLEDSLGYKIGLITNGVDASKGAYRFHRYHLLDWCRVSLHGLHFGIDMDAAIIQIRDLAPSLEISSVYIWTEGSDEVFPRVVEFTERHKIPTRVTPDLTVGPEQIDRWLPIVTKAVKDSSGNYVFMSDFNVKTVRAHDRCYMHMVKPFIFPDGNVYVCPSAALSPENALNVNQQFKVCAIENIIEAYTQGPTTRHHACQFCKYAAQNELVDELLQPTTHNSFA